MVFRKPTPEQIEANKVKAKALGRELDSLGRLKSGMNVLAEEEEEQRWTNPEDPTDTKMVWRKIPPEDQRCRAKIRSPNSPWRGNRCCAIAIKGGIVCHHHGGNLPSVKKAAQRRLAMAALPAADRLIYMALKKKKMSDSDRLKALAMILDRAGVEGKQTVEIEVKPWQLALQSLFDRVAPEGSPALANTIELVEGEDYEVTDDDTNWNEDDE